MFPSFTFLFPLTATTLLRNPTEVEASRAYPHGCLYRHPSYYTYDERDDISWAVVEGGDDGLEHGAAVDSPWLSMDFRRLPPKSSPLRRPYGRYRLTRRLGAGKFSDVFEAVEVQREAAIRAAGLEKKSAALRAGATNTGGGADTEATEREDSDNKASPPAASLVVLKCLKPISERKIRRELLVLTHCATLPNLARVIGIVLPDSMDENGEDEESDEEKERHKVRQQREEATDAAAHRRKRWQHRHVQQENIGSITDASTARGLPRVIGRPPKFASMPVAAMTLQGKTNNKYDKTTGAAATTAAQQLPALVLHHAGRHSQWFCHEKQQQQQVHEDCENNNQHLSEYEMKYYLCHLLVALDGLHAVGIMHRDVKPRNILINRYLGDRNNPGRAQQRRQHRDSPSPPVSGPPPLTLVDLGLADFYLPGKEYNVRVASRHYKSPELLIGFSYYDYAIDMWSAGCILAGLLFRREPFFRGKDNEDQLGTIVRALGTRDFLPYCRKCNVRLSSKARAAIGKYCSRAASCATSSSPSEETPPASSHEPSLLDNDMGRRTRWMSFLPSTNHCPAPSPVALDLLDKLLVYDHEQRWTAREALGHAFFDDVRERVLREVQERFAWEEEISQSLRHGRDNHQAY